ncbi:MAG: hypothetical protein Q4F07_05765 [Bacteroidales bacterium]|nr:hypothetical protein [Bacteroidales bacterium]
MSTTTAINPSADGKGSENKKNFATHAAAAAGAAGLGVAGATFVNHMNDEVEEVAEENVDSTAATTASQTEEQTQPQTGQQAAATAAETSSSTQAATTHTTANTEEIPPVTQETTTQATEQTGQQAAAQGVDQTTTTQTEQQVENVNPDEIAEAIIAEDQIDPNDIDMADVVDFDDMQTIYTVDGETYTVATFHDDAGNELVMVDVDGDNVFDVVTDTELNPLVTEEGHYVSAGGMTTDDVEMYMADDTQYLAANDTDPSGEFGSDTIMDDMIS